MPYVQRSAGLVTGIFANAQPGYAEEWLADDHAEVMAFLSLGVPQTIARHQGLLALLDVGITEAMIRTALDSIEDATERERTRIRFESPQWRRNSEFITWGQTAFGLTDAQTDALFRAAVTL